MNKDKVFHTILFILTILFFLMILIQTVWHPFKEENLLGVTDDVELPSLTFDSLYDGSYQRHLDAYLSQNYGFREQSIKLYNQYIWDFYDKENVDHIVAGKEGWMFYKHHVDDYYGQEMYRWQSDKETAIRTYDAEVKRMVQLRNRLKQYGIEFLMFIAPDKAFIYPEYLPEQEYDTTTVNARKYYSRRFDELGFPYIDMTEMFIQMKDTMSYPIMPPKGAHWNNSCVYGIDTLLHLMSSLKGEQLADFSYGEAVPAYRYMNVENDVEGYINLFRTKKIDKKFETKERQFTILSDSNTVKPNMLFVGNSYLFQVYDYIPVNELFSDISHWYYNRMSYKGFNRRYLEFSEINKLQTILMADYVVWFADGAQIYKTSYGFVEDALMRLHVNEKRISDVYAEVRDSIADAMMAKMPNDTIFDTIAFYNQMWEKASTLILKYPERFFEEIRKDSIPEDMQKKIDNILIGKQIVQNEKWHNKIINYAHLINKTIDKVLEEEIDNIYHNRPLLRDKEIVLTADERTELLNILIEEIKSKPDLLESIRQKAIKHGKTLEQAIIDDANWILEDKLRKCNQ